MKKPIKRLLLIVGILLAVILLLLLCVRLYFRLPVAGYYAASEKGFCIPDTHGGFIAQGLEYDAANDCFLVTGYRNDGAASPLYVVDRASGDRLKTLSQYKADGVPYTGHAGGISLDSAGKYLYVADGSDNCLYVYRYEDIRNASDKDVVVAIGTFSTALSDEDCLHPAFTTVVGDRLIIGEFYRAGNYETPASHAVTTTAGDQNRALALVYALDGTAPYGISPTPLYAYSLPDLVQGLYLDGDTVYLSTSYGPTFSHISVYDGQKTCEGEITVLGTALPLYALDSSSLLCEKKIAPMSEEIVICDGKLYVMCESASDKYIFGKLTSAKWCYGTELSFFYNARENTP